MLLELGVGPKVRAWKGEEDCLCGKVGKGLTGQLHSPDAASSPPSALVADMASILDWFPDRWQR